jgi:hypothetical protein
MSAILETEYGEKKVMTKSVFFYKYSPGKLLDDAVSEILTPYLQKKTTTTVTFVRLYRGTPY